MTSEKENKRKFRLRPGHLIFFIVFMVVRKSFTNLYVEGDEHKEAAHGNTDHSSLKSRDRHSGGGKEHEHGEHEEEKPHFSVFHVNFEHVEVPFIIALWIFVSSLAKVGRSNNVILIYKRHVSCSNYNIIDIYNSIKYFHF